VSDQNIATARWQNPQRLAMVAPIVRIPVRSRTLSPELAIHLGAYLETVERVDQG